MKFSAIAAINIGKYSNNMLFGIGYKAYKIFHNLANDSSRQFEFILDPGKVLTFDNWRLLHARSALVGYRQLCGGYHNREDFESRLRSI